MVTVLFWSQYVNYEEKPMKCASNFREFIIWSVTLKAINAAKPLDIESCPD